ncbi:MAG: hypothetical protein ABEH60_05085 [Halonotius sp.]
MNRRQFLAAVSSLGVSSAGCLDREQTEKPPKLKNDDDPTTLTADGVTATFSVGGGQTPVDDSASARLDDGVVVTGTMEPTGCNRPTLAQVDYSAVDGVLNLKLGVADRYPNREVECGNASYGYTCRCVVDEGTPETVELIHAYAGREPVEFTLDLG